MRFPIHITTDQVGYQIRKAAAGETRYPLVLMLEPLYTCNLACVGCSTERHTGKLSDRLPVETCLRALDECGAPTVSICGGEPTLYPELAELLAGIIERKKHIYLCTNGLVLDTKVFGKIAPHKRLTINVHLDGMRETHDKVCAREGVFDKAIEMIKEAKRRGYHVTTNTTVFKETSVEEIEELCKLVKSLGVDGLLVSPGYHYESVKADIFLTKQEIQRKFRRVLELSKEYRMQSTPMYLEFAAGDARVRLLPLEHGDLHAQGVEEALLPDRRRVRAGLDRVLDQDRLGLLGVAPGREVPELRDAQRASRPRPCGACARARRTCCAWRPGTSWGDDAER